MCKGIFLEFQNKSLIKKTNFVFFFLKTFGTETRFWVIDRFIPISFDLALNVMLMYFHMF